MNPEYVKIMYFPTLDMWKLAIKTDTKNKLMDDIPPEYKNELKLNDYESKRFVGKDFNKYFSHIPLYKITNQNEIHHNMKYEDGLNIDINQQKFDNQNCNCINWFCDDHTDYGINFSDNPTMWGDLYECDKNVCYIRKIIIPEDARVIIGKNKVRSDKVILDKRIPYKDFKE
jgi:hypothetical protein